MRMSVAFAGLLLVATACSSGETVTTGTTFPTVTSTTTVSPTTALPATEVPATTTTVAPTTTTTLATGDIPVASVIASVEAEYQARWDYYQPDKPRGVVGPVEIECDREDDVGFGAVLECQATPLEEREYWPDPFPITILVTGEDGSQVYAEEGEIVADYRAVHTGMHCGDLVASEGTFASYPRAVAYWFLEGKPARMVADSDEIPCEAEFPLRDIADFWHGTSREEATDTHFGTVTDVIARGSGYELTIDYAFFLNGLEADLAAEAAGEIAPGEGVPNDYFIVNDNPRLRTFELANDVYLQLLGYRDNFEFVAVPPSLWIELLAEVERCEEADWPPDCAGLGWGDWNWYGRGQLPYWIQVDDDIVGRIEEQYLP